MPLTRSLVNCRIDVCNQAGIDINQTGGSIERHPTATWVNVILNQAFRSLMSTVTSWHYQLYKVAGTETALPTTPPTTRETYVEVAWPAAAMDIVGIDVFTTGDQQWRPLEPIEWEERRNFDTGPYAMEGVPAPYGFSAISAGSVATTVFTAGTIGLFPAPTGGFYKIWYLPRWDDITTDGHLFLAHDEDWFQWMYWEATRRIAARDNDAQNRLGEAARQLNPDAPDTVASRIKKRAPKHVKAGTKTWSRAWNY